MAHKNNNKKKSFFELFKEGFKPTAARFGASEEAGANPVKIGQTAEQALEAIRKQKKKNNK